MKKTFEQEIEARLADNKWDKGIAKAVLKKRRSKFIKSTSVIATAFVMVLVVGVLNMVNYVDPITALDEQISQGYESFYNDTIVSFDGGEEFVVFVGDDEVMVEWL
jgi:hypothetical protein